MTHEVTAWRERHLGALDTIARTLEGGSRPTAAARADALAFVAALRDILAEKANDALVFHIESHTRFRAEVARKAAIAA